MKRKFVTKIGPWIFNPLCSSWERWERWNNYGRVYGLELGYGWHTWRVFGEHGKCYTFEEGRTLIDDHILTVKNKYTRYVLDNKTKYSELDMNIHTLMFNRGGYPYPYSTNPEYAKHVYTALNKLQTGQKDSRYPYPCRYRVDKREKFEFWCLPIEKYFEDEDIETFVRWKSYNHKIKWIAPVSIPCGYSYMNPETIYAETFEMAVCKAAQYMLKAVEVEARELIGKHDEDRKKGIFFHEQWGLFLPEDLAHLVYQKFHQKFNTATVGGDIEDPYWYRKCPQDRDYLAEEVNTADFKLRELIHD